VAAVAKSGDRIGLEPLALAKPAQEGPYIRFEGVEQWRQG